MTNNFWRDRPTLVTGATGLLGSWLSRRLVEAGAEVVCLVRGGKRASDLVLSGREFSIKFVSGDVTDSELVARTLDKFGIDTVFHLAAQTIVSTANREPLPTFETNIRGTWLLLEACRRAQGVRQLVLASSDKAYGSSATLPYTEETPLRGEYPYEVSKSCADLIAQSYAKTFRLPVAITRCGNFYGGGDLNWSRIVPGTIRSLHAGQAPVIRSDGKFVRDYIHVDDGAAASMLLAERLSENRELAGRAFNFSTEERCTVLELVQRIARAMGSNLEASVLGEVKAEIVEQYLDASRARAELGFRPLYTLDQGLSLTIAWYRDYFRDFAQAVEPAPNRTGAAARSQRPPAERPSLLPPH